MEWALAGTAIICLLFIVGNLLASKGRTHTTIDLATEVSLSDFKEKEKSRRSLSHKK